MTTRRLLWGMTWRGAVWGLLTGTLGGAAYGVLFMNGLFVFLMIFQSEMLRTMDVPPIGITIILLVLFGAIMGVLFGLPIGLLVGTLDGLLIGIVTCALFYPPKHMRAYRWTLILVSAVFTGVTTWFSFMRLDLFLEMLNRSESDFGRLFFLSRSCADCRHYRRVHESFDCALVRKRNAKTNIMINSNFSLRVRILDFGKC